MDQSDQSDEERARFPVRAHVPNPSAQTLKCETQALPLALTWGRSIVESTTVPRSMRQTGKDRLSPNDTVSMYIHMPARGIPGVHE